MVSKRTGKKQNVIMVNKNTQEVSQDVINQSLKNSCRIGQSERDHKILIVACWGVESWLTKKKPAPAGDNDGRMIPAASDSAMYLFMAPLSEGERE